LAEKITKTESEWRETLTEEQFQVCRKKGTEPAFSGKLWDCHDRGIYHCVCCDAPLFSSITKFDSGTLLPGHHSRKYRHRTGHALLYAEDGSIM